MIKLLLGLTFSQALALWPRKGQTPNSTPGQTVTVHAIQNEKNPAHRTAQHTTLGTVCSLLTAIT